MAILKCKMCGGDMEIAADKTFGTCEYCGSTMTLPKVSDEQRAAAFNRGNHFRRSGEFDKALAVYERMVAEDDADAEAHWCCALCRFGIEYVEDPATYEWLPTCHRASFDSFLEDVDYQAAVEYSDGITKRQYQKDAAKIAEVQRGILATSQNEEPFDVFICYKESGENGERTRDSIMAQDIYYQLTEQGKRVFFARITLEDKAGAEYEPYIFAALNSARVMVVVGTKAEYFNAVWVKNEWSRFLSMMKRDRSKLLLSCYKDMDPYDLPEALSVLQSYDMSKIGFVQDLLRGINKVLGKTEKTAPQQTVVVQSEGGVNIPSLLKRAYMALEDKDWDSASTFFSRILDMDAECGDAYIGLFLLESQCSTVDEFVSYRKKAQSEPTKETLCASFKDDAIAEEYVERYSVKNYLPSEEIEKIFDFDCSYTSEVPFLKRAIAAEENYIDEQRSLQRAVRFGKGKEIDQLKDKICGDLRRKLKKCETAENQMLRDMEEKYKTHLSNAQKETKKLYENLQVGENRKIAFDLAESEKIDDIKTAIDFFECFPQNEEMSAALTACKEKLSSKEDRIKNETQIIDEKIKVQKDRLEKHQKKIAKIKAIRWLKRFVWWSVGLVLVMIILAGEGATTYTGLAFFIYICCLLFFPIYRIIQLKRAKKGYTTAMSNITMLLQQKDLIIEGDETATCDADYAASTEQKSSFIPQACEQPQRARRTRRKDIRQESDNDEKPEAEAPQSEVKKETEEKRIAKQKKTKIQQAAKAESDCVYFVPQGKAAKIKSEDTYFIPQERKK